MLEQNGLEASFHYFASDSTRTLDSASFARWVSVSQLKLTSAEVDLIFAKSKDKGQRRVDFRLFKLRAIPMLAEKAGISVDETKLILASVERKQAPSPNVASKALTEEDSQASETRKRRSGIALPDVPSHLVDSFRSGFALFATPASDSSIKQEMDSTRFCKMCKDCGLLGKRLKANDLDILFKKAKQDPIKRKISFETFVHRAVPLLAIASKRSLEVLAHDISNGRPSSTGSVPNTTSGIFSKLTNPSGFTGAHGSGKAGSRKSSRLVDKDELTPVPLDSISGLKDAFRSFCTFGFHGTGKAPDTMDNVKFAKMLRDAGLISKRFSKGDADLAFQKSLHQGSRRITANVFLEFTVPFLAHKLGKDTRLLAELLASGKPKTTNATEVEASGIFEKLTDEKLYTGMYAANAGQDVEEMFLGNKLEHMLAKTELPELPAIYQPGLRTAMQRFCGDSDEMSEESFFRLVRDAGLVNLKLGYNDVSTVYNLCKEKFAEGLDFVSYCAKAIPLITGVRDDDIHRVAKKLVDVHPENALSRMKRAMRKASIFDKLCDPSLFTGMHRAKALEQNSLPQGNNTSPWHQPSPLPLESAPGESAMPNPTAQLRPHTSQGIRLSQTHPLSRGPAGLQQGDGATAPSDMLLYSFLPPRPFTADNHPLMALRPGMKALPGAKILKPVNPQFRDTALTMAEVADQYYFSGISSLEQGTEMFADQPEQEISAGNVRPAFDTQICFLPEIVI